VAAQVVVLGLGEPLGRLVRRQVAELGRLGIGRRLAGPGTHVVGAAQAQAVHQRAFEQAEDLAFEKQAHLGLGRVHVHVDLAGGHLQEGDHHGVAAGGDRLAERLRDGLRQRGAVDRAAVDEDELLFTVAARPGRARREGR
jgi:hypothetical protein